MTDLAEYPALSADATRLLDAAVASIPYGFCVWSPEFRLLQWNRHYLELYRFPAERLHKGMTLEAVVRLSAEMGNHPDQQPEDFLAGYRAELLANRSGARARVRELLQGERWVETVHHYEPGLGWVVTHEDLTGAIASDEAALQRQQELELQNVRFTAIVNNISQGLCMYDAEGRLVICNEPYRRIYELPGSLLTPGTPLETILDDLFARGMQVGSADRDEYLGWRRAVISSGTYGKHVHELNGRVIMMQHHPMADGGWVTTHEDITEQREQEERIEHLARHDPLTQLPNRAQFLEEMAAMEPEWRRGEGSAVLCIDLDHFKEANDSWGHAVGDKLLQQVSARLWGTTRENDVLARLGGDEFAMLLRQMSRPAEAAGIADRIVKAVAVPFQIEGYQISIGASVGIAMAPQDGTSTDRLMKNADLALYRAKSDGRSTFNFFEPGMDQAIQQRRDIEAGLRLALERNEFRLAFQPLIGLKQNRITCFEALLRWTHAERGMVQPAEFIPVAEETGMIVPIGEWVLNEACRVAATWPDEVRVAVNLSPVQFRNGRLFEAVEAALKASRLAPTRLELEITESLLLADNETTLHTLHRLRALGVRISMDDFGTGYSSLSYLRSFPFDKIKIDRSFMRDLRTRGDSIAIVKAVISLAHSLGMATTAEGIETEEQLDAVRQQGCDEVQGFLFSPPLPASSVAGLLGVQPSPAQQRNRAGEGR